MAFCYFIFFTFLYTRDPCNEEMPRTVIYDRKQNVPQQRVGYFLSSFSNSQICIAWHPNPMIQTSRDEGGKKKRSSRCLAFPFQTIQTKPSWPLGAHRTVSLSPTSSVLRIPKSQTGSHLRYAHGVAAPHSLRACRIRWVALSALISPSSLLYPNFARVFLLQPQ
jgi:hypothetical protein